MKGPRSFTTAEWCQLMLLADDIRRTIDADLGHAFERLAMGDESQKAVIHDRLNILARFAQADKIRRIVAEGG